MKNGSKLDEEIWNEFNEKWDKLAYESEMILKLLKQGKTLDDTISICGTEVERNVKVRVNQSFFRSSVLASYEGNCCITGLSTKELLIASHIKPWHICSADEKVNPHNGLCLNALHDMAFDKGFLTIGTDYKIYISKDIKDIFQGETVKRYFGYYEGKPIALPEKFVPDKCFLEYHNDMVFENWKRNL
ncbi:MAG: HNH endonuclease [Butyrivibrio sp.]|nr:HNH endonuclease [Muribaculum sp.]MCM1552328.1 HNH endonuclease [Butyrivibrio sp.]